MADDIEQDRLMATNGFLMGIMVGGCGEVLLLTNGNGLGVAAY